VSLTVGRRTGNNFPVTLAVTDNVGIQQADIYVDGTLQVRLSLPPWQGKVLIKTSGLHTVQAVVYDTSRNTAMTSVVVRR
jgi:D-alanyl-D-alanine carboxypeptidase